MSALQARIDCRRGDFRLRVDTEIPLSGVTGIYGPSGCGKTSLLYSLAGLLPLEPASRVQFGDRCWTGDGRDIPTPERRLGLVFQDARLFPHLSVKGNLEYARRRQHRAAGPDMEQVCGWLKLDGLLDRHVDSLSRGQAQRVAIARTLLNHPDILLLDEPLANIDLGSRSEIMLYLERIGRELDIPIVYVSHNMDELARLADWLLVMEAGEIAAQGPMLELCSRLELAIAHEEQAAAVVSATLVRQEPEFGLSELELAGQSMFVTQLRAEPGATVRLRIPARDVSLCLTPPADSSILNILEAHIEEIEGDGEDAVPGGADANAPSRLLLRLRLADQYLLARITRKSIVRLGLKAGMRVYAQIKSAALLSEAG